MFMLRNVWWWDWWDTYREFLADNPQEGEMVLAEETVAPEDIWWREKDDGKIEVWGYEGIHDSKNVKRLKIPETIDGKQVANIDIQGYEYLLSVEIPGSVSSIGYGAFCGCPRLEKITVDKSNPVYETDDAGVLYNKGKSILIHCPAEVKEIRIPDSVRMIKEHAFYDCYKLEKITVDKSNTAYETDDAGVLYNKGKTTLIYCPPRCKETCIKIPDSVSIIENYAFFGCKSLTSVNIPERITHIGDSAFCGCESLLQIDIPESITHIGYDAFYSCKSLLQIEIPESVTHIGNGAFCGCESLSSINIPSSVSHIGDYVFRGCESLSSINIPSSVSHIGDEAFYGCESLSSINIPSSVSHIGDHVFRGCESLSSINIPSSVSSIGDGAFSWCHKLEKIKVDERNPVYESDDAGVLYNKGKTTLICCPAGTKETSIRIPSSVNVIQGYAFFDCKSLTSVKIPNGITCIAAGTFDNCTSLTNIEISDSVSSIEWNAFFCCESLTSVDIPESITHIGYGAFYGCESLSSINVPSSVSSIEWNALGSCISLKDIYYAGSREQWDAIKINMDGNDALGSATIHYGSK